MGIKQCMKWLSFANHKDNFFFIYNKSEELDENEKIENLSYMCDVLGADVTNTVVCNKSDQQYQIKMCHALGFPRNATFQDVKEDREKLVNSTLMHFPEDRIEIQKSSCNIQ